MTEQIQANMAGILVTSIEGPKAFPIFVKKHQPYDEPFVTVQAYKMVKERENSLVSVKLHGTTVSLVGYMSERVSE